MKKSLKVCIHISTSVGLGFMVDVGCKHYVTLLNLYSDIDSVCLKSVDHRQCVYMLNAYKTTKHL